VRCFLQYYTQPPPSHHHYRRTGRDAEKSTRYVSLMTNPRTHTSIHGHFYHSTNVPDAW
jgi:hypothetical protein